jgi:radical SAM/Cys-rich protein
MPQLNFVERVTGLGDPALLCTCDTLETLQVNITSRCNLACKHCHVSGGPTRAEEMSHETLTDCLVVFAAGGITAGGCAAEGCVTKGFAVLDVTGGAPELHPEYRWFIDQAARIAGTGIPAAKVITRTNLVILTEDGFGDLPGFWAERGIEVVASLPSWDARNYERQRGAGQFERALEGLRLLNAAGYGVGATNAAEQPLTLNLVVNPGGAFLPPAQTSAEREFRDRLALQGLSFDHLLTITNNPTGRFAAFLTEKGKLNAYLERLEAAFNPATVAGMMCRSQISVHWDGTLFDCDFNQAAELPIEGSGTIADVAQAVLHDGSLGGVLGRELRLADHCYACCAGAGSSCGGTTA